ncbi:DUF92 domain-containing protein [Halocatena halophila]|uniref:DUF92 domain-containing protein n=1 Tax=Halocatena halophila TaxID=2814576 RepID=UPI002ED2D2F7
MASSVRRAVGFAVVGTFVLAVPFIAASNVSFSASWFNSIVPAIDPAGMTAIVISLPFLFGTVVSLVTSNGPLFDLFAFPADYEEGRLFGLANFCLAAGGLAAFSLQIELSLTIFVASVLLVVYGNLGEKLARRRTDDPLVAVVAFLCVSWCSAIVGQWVTLSMLDNPLIPAKLLFLAITGGLFAALLRSVLPDRDDPIIILSVTFALWILNGIVPAISTSYVLIALAVTIAFGYLSYALETASITGMLSGVVIAFVTIVLGGFEWFAVLIAFFGGGGLVTKFRYETKRDRGLAQDNEGARGGGNVIANSLVALLAVLGNATAEFIGLSPSVFVLAFAGAVATAMSDTLSSEIGGLYGPPRLITTLKPVAPGTDGGVTLQGFFAGIAGAGVIALLSIGLFDSVTIAGSLIVVAAGTIGMLVDSLLGATIEGAALGNMGVNFLATLSGGLSALGLTLLGGVVVL